MINSSLQMFSRCHANVTLRGSDYYSIILQFEKNTRDQFKVNAIVYLKKAKNEAL